MLLINERRFVPAGDPVDLKVTITASPEPALVGGLLSYSYSVENDSGLTAEDVTVELRLSDGQTLQSGGSPGSPTDGGGIRHFIGDIAPGAKVDFSGHVRLDRLATLVATAVAVSPTLDSDYRDNIASKVTNIGFSSTPNSAKILELLVQDVKVNPANGSLVIAVDADAPEGIANSILVMNPENGLIAKTIRLPGEAIQLAVSGDGTVAYALGTGRNLLYRIDLANGVFSKTLSFAGLSIDDFEVMTGTTDSIVLGSGWNGVRVYDDGMLRPNTSGTYNGDQVELLPDPDLAFAYNTEHTGFESFKLQLGPTGVSVLSENGSLFSGFSNNIRSDGYYIYGPGGAVVRADLMAKTGTFDLTNIFGGYLSIGSSVEPERAKRRAYFAGSKQIHSFDTDTYLRIRNVSFPSLPANIGSLERWGIDGFVSKLANQHLAIIRTDLVPDQPGALDLIVNLRDGDEIGVSPLTVTGKAFAGRLRHLVRSCDTELRGKRTADRRNPAWRRCFRGKADHGSPPHADRHDGESRARRGNTASRLAQPRLRPRRPLRRCGNPFRYGSFKSRSTFASGNHEELEGFRKRAQLPPRQSPTRLLFSRHVPEPDGLGSHFAADHTAR